MPIYSGGGGGGSQPFKLLGPFNFHYNTPGLADGIKALTIPGGDVLLDLWFEIATAWNGTTPLGDVGGLLPFGNDLTYNAFWGGNYGLTGVDMTKAAYGPPIGLGFGPSWGLVGAAVQSAVNAVGLAYDLLQVPAIGAGGAAQQNLVRLSTSHGFPVLPMRFTADQDLHVCVSQTGQTDGSDPGATQGEANLYFITATPMAIT